MNVRVCVVCSEITIDGGLYISITNNINPVLMSKVTRSELNSFKFYAHLICP